MQSKPSWSTRPSRAGSARVTSAVNSGDFTDLYTKSKETWVTSVLCTARGNITFRTARDNYHTASSHFPCTDMLTHLDTVHTNNSSGYERRGGGYPLI